MQAPFIQLRSIAEAIAHIVFAEAALGGIDLASNRFMSAWVAAASN